MHRHVRMLAIVFAGALLVFSGVANGQRAEDHADTPQVTWKAATGKLAAASASQGSKVVKDAVTGQLRQALPGELPDSPVVHPTQIINSGGGAIAIVGDDLMSESIAVRNADGSVTVKHSTEVKTLPEVK